MRAVVRGALTMRAVVRGALRRMRAVLRGTLMLCVLAACGDDTLECDPGAEEVNGTCVPICPSGMRAPDGTCIDLDGSIDGNTDAGPDAPSACTEECTGLTPVCDEENMTCVQCVVPGDCASLGPRTMCADNVCVECTDNSQCMTAEAPVCATDGDMAGLCVPCTGMTGECDGITDGETALGVCDTTGDVGVCVECTAADESACGDFVCDVQNRTCTEDIEPGDAGRCELCVSDSHCLDEAVCVQETFNDSPTEYRCATPIDAPGPDGACSRIPPYIDNNGGEPRMTIAGEEVVVCMLRTTTCQSLDDYSDKDCGDTLGDAADAMCGIEGVDDGLCRMFDAAANRCTYECAGDDDCIGGRTCDTGVTPAICTF